MRNETLKAKEYGNIKEIVRIWWGELAAWLMLLIIIGIFCVCRMFPCTGGFDLWCLTLIPLYGVLIYWFFGRNLKDNPRLCRIRGHVYNAMVLIVSGGAFLCGYFGLTLLIIGVSMIVVATSCFACAASWLFRFRGGRMIGLFVLFLVASILYHKLELKTEHCEYAKNAMVEPIHIANQLIGVALPSRGHLEKDDAMIKPLLYEGCHFFVWIFVFSLVLSFANRELVNRIYLKLTRYKPMYVFWSSEGSSAEECVASSIIAKYALFGPNVVLAVWGKDKEFMADVCDKWKRGRRWVEATPAEYDDVTSYADVHYVLSPDGKKNITIAMSLMTHVKHGKIFVRLDNVNQKYERAFEAYVGQCSSPLVYGFQEEMLTIKKLRLLNPEFKGNDNAFVVGYHKYNGSKASSGSYDDPTSRELLMTEKIANCLGVKCLTANENIDSTRQYKLFFYSEDKCNLLKLLDEIKEKVDISRNSYVYAYDTFFSDMIMVCYDVHVIGSDKMLFSKESIAQSAQQLSASLPVS